MKKEVTVPCKVCGQPVTTWFDHDEEMCSVEQLEQFSRMLTCDPCLRSKGYPPRNRPPKVKQLPLAPPEPRPEREARPVSQIGLPYKD